MFQRCVPWRQVLGGHLRRLLGSGGAEPHAVNDHGSVTLRLGGLQSRERLGNVALCGKTRNAFVSRELESSRGDQAVTFAAVRGTRTVDAPRCGPQYRARGSSCAFFCSTTK